MNHIITISREFGSGGRTVGKKVAEQLGIPCYDSELIQKIAEESGFAENYVKEAGEYTPGGFLASALSNRAFGPDERGHPMGNSVPRHQRACRKGGPASSSAAARTTFCRTRPSASMSLPRGYGVPRQAHRRGLRRARAVAEQRLRDKDKRRAAYHRFYTNMKWGYAQNYHITLDSGELGIDKCADIIADLYKSRA